MSSFYVLYIITPAMPGENYNWPKPKQRNEVSTKYNTHPCRYSIFGQGFVQVYSYKTSFLNSIYTLTFMYVE